MARRRPLAFDSLTDVMPEVDCLLAGYDRGGNWSLGQVCQHLATSLRLTIEGWPVRAPWLVRRTVGPLLREAGALHGTNAGRDEAPQEAGLTPGSELDDRAEAEALQGPLRYYQGCTDPFPEHPMFGR